MKTKLTFIALAIFFLSWFSLITPSDRFADPDAFYHITVAKLISEQGPLHDFPWLDLTTLGSHFADQHFLFHALQIPFLQIFDPLRASQVSSIFFAAICMLGISLVFYKLKIKLWWLWPILLTFTQPFTTRLIQGKASPLAILFWFMGVGSTLSILRRGEDSVRPYSAYVVIFVTSFLFSLTHGGWLLLPSSILLIILGDPIYQRLITKTSARYKILDIRYLSPLAASISGCLAGLLIHPNRSEIFSFLKVQLFDVAVATPRILRMGTEWNTSSLESIISMFGVFGIILLLILLANILIKDKGLKINNKSHPVNAGRGTSDVGRKTSNQEFVRCTMYDVRSVLLLSPLLLLLFVASIKSLRFTEYFQPALALITAYFAQTINWKDLLNKLKLPSPHSPSSSLKIQTLLYDVRCTMYKKLIPSVIAFALLAILVQHIVSAYTSTHQVKRFLVNQYKIPMYAISAIAKPGDIVYNSMWDEFPILFYHNQNLRYISGLDPTFLYKSSSTLALDYQNLVFNTSSTQSDAYSLIHDRLQSDFILIDNERWPHLAELIATDHRYTFLAEGDGGVAYKVEE